MDTVYKSKTIMQRSKHGTSLLPVTRLIRIPQNKYGFYKTQEVADGQQQSAEHSGTEQLVGADQHTA